MQNGQKTISELFDGRKIFKIPKYQRAYAWEAPELQGFIGLLSSLTRVKDALTLSVSLWGYQRKMLIRSQLSIGIAV